MGVMGVQRYQELFAWQLADAFKLRVFDLLRKSPRTMGFKFRDQLTESARAPAKHIVEGFRRYSPRSMRVFLDYAISSLDEAQEHLVDGI